MAFRTVLDKIKNLFLPRPAVTRTRTRRGIAAGGHTGGGPRGKPLAADVVRDFVYGGQVLVVRSSNVGALRYDHESQELVVEYLRKGGKSAVYAYSRVPEDVAVRLAMATSKGGDKNVDPRWGVWDLLRVRGTVHGNRYATRRVR